MREVIVLRWRHLLQTRLHRTTAGLDVVRMDTHCRGVMAKPAGEGEGRGDGSPSEDGGGRRGATPPWPLLLLPLPSPLPSLSAVPPTVSRASSVCTDECAGGSVASTQC